MEFIKSLLQKLCFHKYTLIDSWEGYVWKKGERVYKTRRLYQCKICGHIKKEIH